MANQQDKIAEAYIEIRAEYDRLEREMDTAVKMAEKKAKEAEKHLERVAEDNIKAGRRDAEQTEERMNRFVAAERQREQATRQATDKIVAQHERANGALGGYVGTVLKAVSVFGTLELGIGAANVLMEAFNGDVEKAGEALKQLPAVGGLGRQLETMLGSITGIREEIERIERQTANMETFGQAQLALAESRLQVEREIAALVQTDQQRLDFLNADLGDRARVAAEQRVANRLADAEAEAEAIRNRAPGGDDLAKRIEELRAAVETEKQKLAQIRSAEEPGFLRRALTPPGAPIKQLPFGAPPESQPVIDQEDAVKSTQERLNIVLAERERIRQELQKSAEDRIRIAREVNAAELRELERLEAEKARVASEASDQRQADDARAQAEAAAREAEITRARLAELDFEIEQADRRAGGRDFEAELADITRRYDLEIEAATDAEVAKRLEIRKTQELEAALHRERLEAIEEEARRQREVEAEAERAIREQQRERERMEREYERELRSAQADLDRLEGGAVDSRFARFSDGAEVRRDIQTVKDAETREAVKEFRRAMQPLIDGFLGGTLGVPSVLVPGGA